MKHILLTGGTGVFGSALTPLLAAAGHMVRIMSRSQQPAQLAPGIEWVQANLETGQGLSEAVRGIDTIVHAASNPAQHTHATDVEGTKLLMAAAHTASVAHMIYISIVGVDRIPLPYYVHKYATEEIVRAAGIPFSMLRITQFHEFIDTLLLGTIKLPFLALLPAGFSAQPVAVSDAAAATLTYVEQGRSESVAIGGPEVLPVRVLARNWLQARRQQRLIVELPTTGKIANGFRQGFNTCPEQRVGKQTWEEWLGQRYESEGLPKHSALPGEQTRAH